MNASPSSASAAAPFVVLDFDSTLVKVETLDALADMVLSESAEAEAIRTRVARLTDQAMAGDIDFGEALKRRLELLQLTRSHVEALADRILGELTPSVRRNARFFAENAGAHHHPLGRLPRDHRPGGGRTGHRARAGAGQRPAL